MMKRPQEIFDAGYRDRFSAACSLVRSLADLFKTAMGSGLQQLVEEEGVKMGQLAQPVRVALTGRKASPGLFDVMEILGRDRTLFRLRQGVERASV